MDSVKNHMEALFEDEETALAKASYDGLAKGMGAEECVMPATRILILCAGPGMGKTTTLSHMVLRYLEKGIAARYYDFMGMRFEETISRLRDALRWSRSQARNLSGHMGTPLVALDNVTVGDECDVERMVRLLRRLVEEGGSAAIGILPEDELLAEQLGEACCRWSCDMRLPRPANASEAELYDLYSQGIPLLASCLSEIGGLSVASTPTDVGYQEAYISMLESIIRPRMIEDERRLRCSMLLLGSGSLCEVEDALGGVDNLLWRLLARDAPFFGVNRVSDTFCCVGGQSVDCLNVAYPTLSQMVRPWPQLVSVVCGILAKRGDFARAAVISLMCADDAQRCSIGLKWGVRMIEAGEVNVAEDARETARSLGLVHLEGFYETSCVLAALGDGRVDAQSTNTLLSMGDRAAQSVWLAVRCRLLFRGKGLGHEFIKGDTEDPLVDALVTHGTALQLLIDGRLAEAYELLLECPLRLESKSVSCALLEVDYALCSLLAGTLPGPLDMEALQEARALFERAGLSRCLAACDAVVAMGRLLGGRSVAREAFEPHIQRATRDGDVLLRGVFLLVSGVSDMRVGALTRCHVRLSQAQGHFTNAKASALEKIALMLDLAVRAQLGERVPPSEIHRCKGVTQNMDRVVTLLEIALTSKEPGPPSMRGWKTDSCPRDIHWVVNVLSADGNAVSRRFKRALPASWFSSVLSASTRIDEYFGDAPLDEEELTIRRSGGIGKASQSPSHSGKAIEVRMLGGFEVYAGGNAIPSNRLERRRAKSVLAVLAAVPGHVARRYTIMESVWPTYDYSTANKCLYSATSVLRAELGGALGDVDGSSLVLTNKVEGTISLDMSNVGCDVDVFEEKARKLLDMEGVDHQAVAICREVEELYRGDLYVPPADGMGVVQNRARQIRELYADSMVAGSVAALNMGMKSLACRFARKACDADELREDAMQAFVVALCASGRHIEAERRYERFVGKVVDMTRRPPSRRLREMVEGVLNDAMPSAGGRRRPPRKNTARVRVEDRHDDAAGVQLALDFENGTTS